MSAAAGTGFVGAVNAIFAEQSKHLRVHCTLDELRAYHQRSLSAARREEVAEHLSLCEDCTILLLFGIIGPTPLGYEAEPSREEVESAWRRLRPRLRNGSREGRPLARVLEKGQLPLDQALPLALEVTNALRGLHSRGRVLSNVWAEHALITSSGEVSLLDLGFSPTPESLEVGYGGQADETLIHLYASLSPEQVAGEGLDQRSNLFSLGALLYEMLTGVSPFRDSTPLGTVGRVLSLDPPPARELNPAVEPALSDLLTRLLAKEAEERPPSASAVVRELEGILGRRDLLRPAQGSEPMDIAEQIERLYDEIIVLTQGQGGVGEANRDEEIERAYERLLELQKAEAERFRQQFEASLAMPIDAGDKILARVRSLREELEDLASSDPAAEDADPAPAPANARR